MGIKPPGGAAAERAQRIIQAVPHLVIQVKKKSTQKVGPSVSDVKTDSRNRQNCNEALVWSSSRLRVQFHLNPLEFLITHVG